MQARTPDEPGAGLQPVAGMRLGPYLLLHAVAQGGMARLWAAWDLAERRIVALKTIRPEFQYDAGYRQLFVEEARFASAVRHPSVCEVYGQGEEQGLLYLAMEWVVGESLTRILKPQREAPAVPLEPRVSARIIAGFCDALHAAHELRDEMGKHLRLVHCDVSLQNLLVTAAGSVKLVDFGVAQALGAPESSQRPKLDGKAAYMAPEHAAGKRISRLSDVFTLGICLYEMTTAARPFATGSRDGTIERLLSGEFVEPSQLIKGYPLALERILMRAMTRDPMYRYPSARRMRAALEDWIKHSGPPVDELVVARFLHERAGDLIRDREAHIASLVSHLG